MQRHPLFNKSLLCVLSVLFVLLTGCNNSDKTDADPAPETPPSKTTELDAAIAKASDALWKMQGEDGGWHSPVYGHFKPGAAETPLVLAVLARLPADELAKHDAAVKKALKFIADQTGKDGGLGTKGEWFEVPTYATALGILAYTRLKPDGWQKTIEPWVAYLKSSQNSEENGCKPGDAPYGGWGPEGKPDNWRRADISSTRFALQALHAAGVAKEDKVWKRAEAFLKRLQALSENGWGFTFSTTNFELNKAGREAKESPHFKPYGSTTADGAFSWMIIDKYSPSRESAGMGSQAAVWLMENADIEHCPGLQNTELEKIGWKDGLSFYYRNALALEKGQGLQNPPFDFNKLAAVTIKSQLKDGTWVNETTVMKEDDPLIATPFALETLILCREALSKK